MAVFTTVRNSAHGGQCKNQIVVKVYPHTKRPQRAVKIQPEIDTEAEIENKFPIFGTARLTWPHENIVQFEIVMKSSIEILICVRK